MIIYNILIILFLIVIWYIFIFKNKNIFSINAFFIYYSFTWVLGSLIVENGYFSWPANYIKYPNNNSAIFLVISIIIVLFFSFFTKKIFLRLFFLKKHKKIFVKKEIPRKNMKFYINFLFFIINLILLFILFKDGIPLFSDHPDLTRRIFWNDKNYLKLFVFSIIPNYYVFLFFYFKKRNLFFRFNVFIYFIILIFLARRQNIIYLLIPLLISFYYENITKLSNKNKNKIILLSIIGFTLFLFFFSFLSYYNMPSELEVMGKILEKKISSGFIIGLSRFTLGQGETFWRIFNDYINEIKILDSEKIKFFSKEIFGSKLLGIKLERENTFSYFVTKTLTTEWFANDRNLVITYVGEGILYIGFLGGIIWSVIAGFILGFLNFGIKKNIEEYKILNTTIYIFIFTNYFLIWINMGNIFTQIRIMNFIIIVFQYCNLFVLKKILFKKIRR